MRSIAPYPLAALCGLLMIVALFLKWFNLPSELALLSPGIQASYGPSDILNVSGFDTNSILKEPMGIALAGSFVLAAAVAVLGFFGGTVPRLFAILTGIAPFGILGWAYYEMRDQIPEGVTLPGLPDLGGSAGIMDKIGQLTPFLDIGFYAYFGSAVLLVLLGLFSPSKKLF